MGRKKRGNFNVQELYDNGKLLSNEFYIGATNIIKSRLMPDLVWKGYYKDGVKQSNYDMEDVDDCYTYVLGKIIEKYNPSKGKIATFIRTWVQGYGSTVTQRQKRRYKKINTILPLDLSLQTSIPEELRDEDRIENLEDYIDETYFNDNSSAMDKTDLTVEDILRIRKEVQESFWKV